MTPERAIELVQLYAQGAGNDDIAGAEFQKAGDAAKTTLLALIDDPATPIEIGGVVLQILHVYFPSDESYDAIERFVSRLPDPQEREAMQQVTRSLRAMPRQR